MLSPLAGVGAGHPVQERQLENGMRVLVKPDHRAPVVISQIWYGVGSSYEPSGITGVSHVLEHMMFKGTPTHGPGEFSRIISENGGTENAFTGTDYTAYYQELAKDRLPIALELEADRMRNLLLQGEEFTKELAVVQEERRLRTEDKPFSLTQEQFNAVAFRHSPYRNPVIGWMSDLESLEISDLQEWYRRWYAPNNAILVVAGDLIPDEVFALAEKYFGSFKPESLVPPKPRSEPKQLGPNRIVVRAPANEPYLILGFKTPVLRAGTEDWEPYALEMLLAVLDGGSSARLSENLVRGARVAAAIDVDYSAYMRLPGTFSIDGIPTPGNNVADLERAVMQELEKLKNELVTDDELARVRAQVLASRVYEQDSLYYQALQIGFLETIGLDWTYLDRHVTELARVTAEQVRDVARKYLVEDALTVAVLDPLPISESATTVANSAEDIGHVN